MNENKTEEYRRGYRSGYEAGRKARINNPPKKKKKKSDLSDMSKMRFVGPAYWIATEFDGYADGSPVPNAWECSNCGREVHCDIYALDSFCGNCGCAMGVKTSSAESEEEE